MQFWWKIEKCPRRGLGLQTLREGVGKAARAARLTLQYTCHRTAPKGATSFLHDVCHTRSPRVSCSILGARVGYKAVQDHECCMKMRTQIIATCCVIARVVMRYNLIQYVLPKCAKSKGWGFLEIRFCEGFRNPPPFFQNAVCGGFKGGFRCKHPICGKIFFVMSFWAAYPCFCPCPQCSHF